MTDCQGVKHHILWLTFRSVARYRHLAPFLLKRHPSPFSGDLKRQVGGRSRPPAVHRQEILEVFLFPPESRKNEVAFSGSNPDATCRRSKLTETSRNVVGRLSAC